MEKLIAFHGKKETKSFYLNRVKEHRIKDELLQRATGENGKGCAVWCTLNKYEHASYETELGIPIVLARLEDGIFEALSVEKSQKWPERFLKAIKPGADLSMVWPKFAHWLLINRENGVIRHAKQKPTKKAIQDVAELYQRWIKGDKPTTEEWLVSRSAAYAAAAADADADAYAAYAAADADADAAAAAYAAAAAAADDDDDDDDDARKKSRLIQSNKLIELLKECK